ncbi:TadE/TadG family type IV pilus assembly protein [Acidimangrovimonas sediminis]|uniref:TadE/TadG family type IV pilus assembly protein n=1 Tax=Acidimangrovimonas sediminis TaxID=2056283 RepID=UPI000C805146|nr:TadE/TadG family type IV pilus assembly protein [Acidimangrovimonas sediminis]
MPISTVSLLIRKILRFLRDERGVVTMEFVVLLPVIILLLAFIGFVSFAISAQSEVQQVAFELARFGLVLADDPKFSGDICSTLNTEYLPKLIANSVTLSSSGFSALQACPGQPSGDVLTIDVTYNLASSYAQAFASDLGINLGEITREASVIVD